LRVIALLRGSGIGVELTFLARAQPASPLHTVDQYGEQDDYGNAVGEPVQQRSVPPSMAYTEARWEVTIGSKIPGSGVNWNCATVVQLAKINASQRDF
jgi:hypothetical protein